MDLIYECALFVLGLIFGSFLNVCISRIPRDESVISPRSCCPACGAPIRWRDNVPILSWLLLHGRCRDCGETISWRYPAVELLLAFLFMGCYISFGPSWLALKFCVFCFLMVGLLFMDSETGLLPREFTYTGIVLGLAFAFLAPTDSWGTRVLLLAYGVHLSDLQISIVDSLLGAVAGAGFFFVAAGLYFLLRKRQGMGSGDFALMAMSGIFLGLRLTLLVIFLAPVLATVYAVALIARRLQHADDARSMVTQMLRKTEIPFGVFISAASLAVAFFGEEFWRWYVGLF